MKFLTYSSINLKNKMAGYFTSKKYLLGNNRELQASYGKTITKSNKPRGRTLFMEKRMELGGVILTESPLEERGGSHRLSCRGSRFLVEDAIYNFPCCRL